LAIDELDLESDFKEGSTALDRCFEKLSSQRLLAVRRNLTHLTGGEAAQNHLYDLTQASHFEFLDMFLKGEAWKIQSEVGLVSGSRRYFETAMRISVAIAALKPWGLPVVLPRSLVHALYPWLGI
jgi:hypothetical protein